MRSALWTNPRLLDFHNRNTVRVPLDPKFFFWNLATFADELLHR